MRRHLDQRLLSVFVAALALALAMPGGGHAAARGVSTNGRAGQLRDGTAAAPVRLPDRPRLLARARRLARPHVAALAPAAMCGRERRAPRYRHVIYIYEENESFSSIVGSRSAPYINRVIRACGLATNYHNITHPSLPEYIATTSALPLPRLFPFLGDCDPGPACRTGANNIFHQVVRKGGWMAFAESMPSNCGRTTVGRYAARHNPAVYYTDLTRCSQRDVPLGRLDSSALLRAFASQRTAPAFATVTPNICDDMHWMSGCVGSAIGNGDAWLAHWLPRLTGTRVYRDGGTVIFIVWDEGDPPPAAPASIGEHCATDTTDPGCHVANIVVAPSVPRGRRVGELFNHYSLLKTTEQLLGVPQLAQARAARSMERAFNL